jgi:UDP-N-acetyl-D-mannosaminuronic acid dehydrogenase
MIRMAREVNLKKTDYIFASIIQQADRFRKPKVGVYILTYKPDVDDVRESPEVEILERLINETDFRINYL